MKFEPDDLDCAMGELLTVFEQAMWEGRWPHELNPTLFHAAWTVINAQPFEVSRKCYLHLMAKTRYSVVNGRVIWILKWYAHARVA